MNRLLEGGSFSLKFVSFSSGSVVEKYLMETGDHDEGTARVKDGL
jgi:hypothetical protein